MLTITVKNDKIILDGLRQAAEAMPGAVKRGLTNVAIGVNNAAFDWLSGAGGANKKTTTKYVGFVRKDGTEQEFRTYQGSGAYPVPVRTGHLRRLQNWLKPGQSKSGEAGTFRAGDMEVVVYNSASYARSIHDGLGSSRKFGRRPFLEDGFKKFNEGDQVVKTIQAEIDAVLAGVKG